MGHDAAESVENLAEENPHFLRKYRVSARAALEERMEELGIAGVRGVSEDEAAEVMQALREDRKRTAKNVWVFMSL